MSLSGKQQAAMLDTLDGKLLALHTSDPGTTGAHELSGAGYARRVALLAPAAAGEKSTSDVIDFPDLPSARITHFGLWSGSEFLWGGALEAPVSIASGDTLRFPASALTFAVS